jgi:hypothetical protein
MAYLNVNISCTAGNIKARSYMPTGSVIAKKSTRLTEANIYVATFIFRDNNYTNSMELSTT